VRQEQVRPVSVQRELQRVQQRVQQLGLVPQQLVQVQQVLESKLVPVRHLELQ
jgi:hypothetical protein